MKWFILFVSSCFILATFTSPSQAMEKDIIKTSEGNLTITFVGHGTLIFEFGKKVIHIDPYSKLTDYTSLPKADVIFITHEHRDHLDLSALEKIRTDKTGFILNQAAADKLGSGKVMKNGDRMEIAGLTVEAVPAYNLVHMRSEGVPFHPEGNGNGYIITFGDKKVYVAGDTENVPEMKALKDIDIAFLPMNLPYTMTPEMVADAAKAFRPTILYPYHFGETDTSKIVELLKDTRDIEVRIRSMK